MSKAEEIALLHDIVSKLPKGSYLESIFKMIQTPIANAIMDDFGCIDWHELYSQQVHAQACIVDAEKRLGELKEEIRDKGREISRIKDVIDKSKQEAISLARMLTSLK